MPAKHGKPKRPKKPTKDIKGALLRGRRFAERGKIEMRIDKLELKELIRKEGARNRKLWREHGKLVFYSSLTIAGLSRILESLALPKTRRKRIFQLEARLLKIGDYLLALRGGGVEERTLEARDFKKLIKTYCDLLGVKIKREWKTLGEPKRNQLKRIHSEYSGFLARIRRRSYELEEIDEVFLKEVIELIHGEIDCLAGHEANYYRKAKAELSKKILERYGYMAE